MGGCQNVVPQLGPFIAFLLGAASKSSCASIKIKSKYCKCIIIAGSNPRRLLLPKHLNSKMKSRKPMQMELNCAVSCHRLSCASWNWWVCFWLTVTPNNTGEHAYWTCSNSTKQRYIVYDLCMYKCKGNRSLPWHERCNPRNPTPNEGNRPLGKNAMIW